MSNKKQVNYLSSSASSNLPNESLVGSDDEEEDEPEENDDYKDIDDYEYMNQSNKNDDASNNASDFGENAVIFGDNNMDTDERSLQLDRAYADLNMVDSLMNIDIIQSLQLILQRSSDSPLDVVKRLASNYTGYAQMTRALIDISRLVHKASETSSTDETLKLQYDAEQDIALCVADIIKHKYSKTSGDSLIHKLEALPAWLGALMEDPLFRKMLIELYDQNRSSTLLGICLREISAKGHHRYATLVSLTPHAYRSFSNVACVFDIGKSQRLSAR